MHQGKGSFKGFRMFQSYTKPQFWQKTTRTENQCSEIMVCVSFGKLHMRKLAKITDCNDCAITLRNNFAHSLSVVWIK